MYVIKVGTERENGVTRLGGKTIMRLNSKKCSAALRKCVHMTNVVRKGGC